MFNMFVVTLVPFKSHCYLVFLKFISHLTLLVAVSKYGSSKSTWPIFWNRDIVYIYYSFITRQC